MTEEKMTDRWSAVAAPLAALLKDLVDANPSALWDNPANVAPWTGEDAYKALRSEQQQKGAEVAAAIEAYIETGAFAEFEADDLTALSAQLPYSRYVRFTAQSLLPGGNVAAALTQVPYSEDMGVEPNDPIYL
ncbi:MAG TPA: hypothetical protein VMR74_12685 [Gammaproteobacteria bacterium]|nr:hypothetical protein [Gammaproteobacteria bacterium]